MGGCACVLVRVCRCMSGCVSMRFNMFLMRLFKVVFEENIIPLPSVLKVCLWQ